MKEKTGNTEKMEYPFNEAKTLEVFLPKAQRWHRVTCVDFRSWDGRRRISGETYEGPLYAYGTNRMVTGNNEERIIESEILVERNNKSQKIRF
jgi:hypothetical protein